MRSFHCSRTHANGSRAFFRHRMHEQLSRLAERLVEHGLAHAFGVTGSGASLRLITELEARGVRYLPTSHEAAAAIMAGAGRRAGGRGPRAPLLQGARPG